MAATNFVQGSYSEVYDLATSKDCPTVIGVHTPVSLRPQAYLKGFYDQYRYVRYKGCKLTMVPASTLPVDPLGVSYEAGEPTVDPRDMLNPMLHFGCNGDDLGAVLNELMQYYGIEMDDSSLQFGSPKHPSSDHWLASVENLYYQMLTAKGVRKTGLQEGLTRSLYPLVSKMMANKHIGPSNNPRYAERTEGFDPDSYVGWRGGLGDPQQNEEGLGKAPNNPVTGAFNSASTEVTAVPLGGTVETAAIYEAPQFFTQGKERLGWMPTITPYAGPGKGSNSVTVNVLGSSVGVPEILHRYTTLPKVMMYCIMMPKAKKTRFYYRAVIRHYFEFREFHSAVGAFNIGVSGKMRQWDPIVTHYPGGTKALKSFQETVLDDTTIEAATPDVEIKPLTDSVA